MNFDVKQLAAEALAKGKQHVEGTKDLQAYHIGKCRCPLVWNAYDAGQVPGVAQGFVAHMMRRHDNDS